MLVCFCKIFERQRKILNDRGKIVSTVFRVVKNNNYTTLSNYHFKDKRLSWKGKGLLSNMLSLPENWNYPIEGLAKLSEDGVKATNSGLVELEKYGYLVRQQLRGENGHFGITCYTIYEQPVEQETDPLQEQEKELNDYNNQPLCQNRQTAESIENTAFLPLGPKRQTEKRLTGKGRQLNTNILNTKELNTYSSSSDDVQQAMQKNLILDEESKYRLRKRFEVDQIAKKYSCELDEAVFCQICKNAEFVRIMNARAMEQVCRSIMDKQKKEPIRMLPNLINTYLNNIMLGIKAAGDGSGIGPTTIRGHNAFNNFPQNQYDFNELEKEILGN